MHEVSSGQSPDLAETGYAGRLLRVWFGNPWDDYDHIRLVQKSGQGGLVSLKALYFNLAIIRELPSSNALEHLQVLSGIQHPNITTTYNMYCCNNRIFVVTEYLEISLAQLDFQTYHLEEWEVATIILEVQYKHLLVK